MRYSSFSLFSGGGFRVERYVLFTASLVLAACACLTFAFILCFSPTKVEHRPDLAADGTILGPRLTCALQVHLPLWNDLTWRAY